MGELTYRWFVHTNDEQTRNAIAQRLSELGVAEENYLAQADVKTEPRGAAALLPLWECPDYAFITTLQRMVSIPSRIRIFRRCGGGRITEVTSWFHRRPHLPQKKTKTRA
ncbi:MAG: hypothetical protein COU09_02860 [Candidatus Harrisonbacteria bacterium CG10_big_fil_rev_8_21_14_0_10_44_23]|uniref:Uncharacterized protein n=1 Tax=Candidatus Harrisonbacteria bacterium CG10_big_fil_rev_8_21_14_0_10_44_23 TaxID=1974585 RepID=A0A2H0UPN5_9BACT|nr:MAG: hypothetical protein COU09_02860 [Candidatus Harrisonbacteria bacterium CG10_big_fil_rev_8_21_14_0_10_44_23]